MAEAVLSISNASCSMPDIFWTVQDKVYFSAYYIATPVFFVLGLIGHVLCIVALTRQPRKDGVYTYQIYVELGEIGELISFAIYTMAVKWWSGAEDVGSPWYQSSYGLMWFTARLATPISNVFITTALLLSLSMALDRALALSMPHEYKAWNRRRHRTIALVTSIVLGVSTTLFAVKRYGIRRGTDSQNYEIYIDEGYASSIIAILLSNIRNVLRTSAVFTLIVCNFVIVTAYRSHAERTNSYAQRLELLGIRSPSVAARNRTEQMLTVMAIVESATTATGMLALTSYFLVIFTKPSFTNCGGLLMIPIVDTVFQGSNIAKFFVIIAINRKFRSMINDILPLRLRRVFGVERCGLRAAYYVRPDSANLRTSV